MTPCTIDISTPLRAANAGLFISRGWGRHPDRILPFFDLIYVRTGSLYMREEEADFVVGPGQSLLLWPERRHYGTRDYDEDLSFYWIHFELTGDAPPSTSTAIDVPQHAAVYRPDRLTEAFRRYLDDQQSGMRTQLHADLTMLQILSEVAMSPSVSASEPAGAVAPSTLAELSRTFIRSHFHEDISAATVADAVGCNPNYLARVYKQAFDQTLTDAIHHARMENARRLLIGGHHGVSEISRLSGFADDVYFRRIFKRHHGITPTAYRRLYTRVHVNTA